MRSWRRQSLIAVTVLAFPTLARPRLRPSKPPASAPAPRIGPSERLELKRAITRIGEISAEMETAAGRPNSSQPRQELSKAAVLKAAGISTSAAHRAEKLAAHKAQVEAYIAKKAAQRQPVKYTEAMAAVEHGAAEIVEVMDAGKVAPSLAAKIAKRPKPQQQKIAAKVFDFTDESA